MLEFKYLIFYFNLLFFAIFANILSAQQSNYFPPLGEITAVSSLVGEIRPDHFHTGLDFSTYGKNGLKVYAIDSGFVSRIKISGYGYGKVVYIAHYDGRESVYAHLQQMSEPIWAELMKWCYQAQMADAEIYLAPDVLKVKRGEVIGLSGNTGRSYAPHLHFEIRDYATAKALQVWNYAYAPADKTKPVISSISVYDVSETYEYKQLSAFSATSTANHKAPSLISLNSCSGKIGFGIVAWDMVDNSSKDLNPYKWQLFVNDSLRYELVYDSISFDDYRKVNAMKDLGAYRTARRKINLLFSSPYLQIPNVKASQYGILHPQMATNYRIKMVVYDVAGNKSECNFQINVKNIIPETPLDWDEYLHPDSNYHFENVNYTISMTNGTIYYPSKSDILLKKMHEDAISDKLWFMSKEIPMNNTFSLGLRLNEKWVKYSSKVYLHERTSHKNFRTAFHPNNMCVGKPNTGGEFTLLIDTIPPNIKYLNNVRWVNNKLVADFIIGDSSTGLSEYHAYVGDTWLMTEYDSKYDKLTVEMPADALNKTLTIVLYDWVYNKTTKSVTVKMIKKL